MTRRALSIAMALALTGVVWAAPAGAAEANRELVGVNGFPALVEVRPGDTGLHVKNLQAALADAGFYHYAIDGVFGQTTSGAVVAFHKYLDLPRTDTFGALDWIRLELLPNAGLPVRWDESNYIEVDLGRQLMFIVRENEPLRIFPVSSGGGYTYWSVRNNSYAGANTPRGDFTLRSHQWGWSCDSVTGWCVYKYWAFSTYYGVHGYRNVPTYPASHGCVRLHTWDSDFTEPLLFVGMPIHIWDNAPLVQPHAIPAGPESEPILKEIPA